MRARTAMFVLLAALAVPTFALDAAADPWTMGKGEWSSSLEGSVFSAPSFYAADKERHELGYTTEQWMLRSSSELGWKRGMSVLIGLPAVSVTRTAGTASASTSGLQDLLLGLKLKLKSGASAAALAIDYNAPLGYDRRLGAFGQVLGDGLIYADSLGGPQTVDGLQQLSAGLEAGTSMMGRAFIQGSVGYAYRYYSFLKREKTVEALRERDESGAIVRTHTGWGLWGDRLLTSADLGVWVSPSVLVAGRYRGMSAIDQGPLLLETSQTLAGAMVLYRVDDHLDVKAGSWSTASGKNVLHYDQFYVGVAFHQSKLNRLQGFSGSTQKP
jgi:hypothetical protein